MSSTKPEGKAKKYNSVTNNHDASSVEMMKIHFPDGLIVEVSGPYCTPQEWASRTSMTEDEVKQALYDRRMARHQFSPRGDLFVNVVMETRRLLDAKPWNR
ncbi:hypothetical protein [Marinomonas posidonica]|uniref:hypothetical protein n=1 Tax=Marinomonas posidonica TaxID=936476 RepID=UPI003736532B